MSPDIQKFLPPQQPQLRERIVPLMLSSGAGHMHLYGNLQAARKAIILTVGRKVWLVYKW